ncbi:MAG TPA: glycosyltransferase family 39 protein [Thermoanaerobaculia bacterium]|nr:glycosyltransferase family 39 protein [Thermoanaerobaculia bacterium]
MSALEASRTARRGGPALFLALTALLWVVSRGKWSDPLIDSGREWIVPDALARGALLYRDVVYWFGPFTPYFQAGFFRLFGSSFSSLVAAGLVTTAACAAALYLSLRRVTGRREAALWCSLAVPALFFMPHAGGSILGMGYRMWQAAAFALLAVSAAVPARGRVGVLVFSGALAALSGLCRTEWGIAAACAVLLAVARSRGERGAVPRTVAALSGFVLVFGAVLGSFLVAAGPRAVLEDGHVLLGHLPDETREFLVAFSGIRDWRRGLAELAYSAALWAGVILVVEMLSLRAEARRRGVLRVAACFAVLAAAALLGGAAGAIAWSAAPFVSATAMVVGLQRHRGPRGAALAAFGFLGVALSYRRLFHIGDSAYVGPPLLFAFVCAAGLLRLRLARVASSHERRRLRAALAGVVALAVAAAFAARLRHYVSWEGDPIAGTAGLLTARPEIARDIEAVSATVRQRTSPGSGLAVFPEGELLNYLSGRRNPARYRLYLPGYVTDDNEPAVLAELEKVRPAAVVVWLRPTGEYGRGLFGVDYGKRLRAWIDREYEVAGCGARGAPARHNPRFLCGFRRAS